MNICFPNPISILISSLLKFEKVTIPLQPPNSLLNLPNPAINGLSCILFPFFPLSPHRFANPPSSSPSSNPEPILRPFPFTAAKSSRGVLGLVFGALGALPPPRIAETELCAHRACFRIADVTVMHSVVMRATGSTATETGVLRE